MSVPGAGRTNATAVTGHKLKLVSAWGHLGQSALPLAWIGTLSCWC